MKNTSGNSSSFRGIPAIAIVLVALIAAVGCASPFSSSSSGSTDTPAVPPSTPEASSYTVSFDSAGATTPATPSTMTVAASGATVASLPTPPLKTSFNFAGWFTQPDGAGTEFSASTPVAADITVHAKWSAAPVYVVTFDGQGASTQATPSSISVTDPATTVVSLPTPPAKTGYLFGGWWTESVGGLTFAADTTVSSSRSVYAHWDSYSYTVTFDGRGATSAPSPASKTVASPATTVDALPSDPALAGSYFGGWWTAPDGGGSEFTALSAVSGDATVYAKWSSNPVRTLSFDSRGGSAVASKSVVAGQAASAPAAPSRAGYAFAGWYKDEAYSSPWSFAEDLVEVDTTLYAKWSIVSYTISYAANGGEGASNPSTYTVESSTISLASPWKTGYTFAGWYSDSGFSTQVSQIAAGSTGDLSLNAKWSPIAYPIYYHLDGGANGSNPSSYTIETPTFSFYAAAKSGNSFAGWYSDEALTVRATQIAQGSIGSVNLYAKWIASYSVVFDSQGATTLAYPSVIVVASPATTVGSLPTAPARTGYTFGGWYSAMNGAGSSFGASSVVSADTTVYAAWTPVSYSISYSLDGGSNSGSNPSTYTIATPTISLAAATRVGYSFVGWYSDAALTSQVTSIAQGSTGNRSLYAAWWSTSSSSVATPAFSPAAGTYGSTQSVSISCATSGATIMYTTDGTTWSAYSSPISVSGDGADLLVTAYAIKTGMADSEVSGAEYIIDTDVAPPVVSVSAGTYTSDPTVTISCATIGAAIYYTLDGSAPTASSTLYTGPISLDPTTSNHIRAIAVKDGMTSSSLDAGSYAIDASRVSTPQFSVAAGSYSSDQSVAIASFTAGASIRYTTDGSAPTRSHGTLYSSPIALSSATTLKAIAYADGLSDSTVVSATYAFPAPAPTSTIVATGQAKKISVTWKAVPGATSYNLYWIKGSTVTTSTVGVNKVTGASSGVVVPSLTNGWLYSFIVTAVNSYGEGSPSAAASTQPHS